MLTWLQRYRVRHYLRNSIWVPPVVGMVVALVAVRLIHWIEEAMSWESTFNPETARALLGTLAASMFTFIVFVCSALLVAVQLASSLLTPRIIAFVFQEPVTKWSLTVFIFAFTFSLGALVRIQTTVPLLTAEVAAYSCLVSLGVFIFLIDHLGKFLRPSGALRTVGRIGHQVIDSVYPQRLAESRGAPREPASALGAPAGVIDSPQAGVVLAFDLPGLVALAQRGNCVIELVPQVGDFVEAGEPLFRIYQGGANLSAIALCQSVAVGQERTLEQDPAFAFRIMVDVASKGLSPAINDPTTAVIAIDQIHLLLRAVGSRCLDDGCAHDAQGQLRLLYRTPSWGDYVHLAITEIRHFGGTSIQVARRLQAMLENLLQTLPPERAPLLRQELDLLHRSAVRFFPEPEDRALAEVGDFQGVGGRHGSRQANDRTNEGRKP